MKGVGEMTTTAPRWTGNKEAFVDDLFAWLRLAGATHYDEQVTQLEHALQTAEHARREGASEPDIVAALLHDVGHFLVGEHQDEMLSPRVLDCLDRTFG